MSWSGFVKTMNRAGTTLMQKAGQVEKTVDPEFEEQERRFKILEASLEKLHNETRGYLDSAVALCTSQQRTAEAVCQLTADGGVGHPSAEQYKQQIEDLDSEVRTELDHNIRATVLEPVGRMVAHFPMINDTIKRRHNKLLDYDSARTKASKLSVKPNEDHIKVHKADTMAREAQDSYEKINTQLLKEMPRLVDSRLDLLDPSFEALVKSQLQFATKASETFEQLQAQLPLSAQDSDKFQAESDMILSRMKDLTICGLV